MSKKNDEFFSKKKEWSKIKDELLGCYLKPYFSKIIHTKRPVVYVDCFAGKGKFDSGEDGSPLIALKIINESIASSKVTPELISTYFIDINYASDLEKNLSTYKNKIVINIISGAFEKEINGILSKHMNANIFLYIDPCGIKALDILKLKTIFKKFKLASIEILINFNYYGFLREACKILNVEIDKSINNDYSKFFVEYDNSSVDSEENMNRIFGSSSWKKIVYERKNNKISASKVEIMLSEEFSKNLQASFKYVLNMPIKNDKRLKYRMIHVTNHVDGCILMANNMYARSKNQRANILNGKIPLFDYDVDDKITDPESRTRNLLSLIGNNEIEIRELLCNYYIKFGINSDTKGLIDILKKNKNKLIIKRDPEKTKKGKPTTFWFSNGQHLFLKKM